MSSFAEVLSQGTAHAWLFIPSAILLGALHGLEPGHSKTMMAAFIVAVRGTVSQAILLGLAATLSHTIVVWGIALGGMYLWQGVDTETFEPYFQLVSAIIIVSVAIWMFWRTRKDQLAARSAAAHHHDHADHPHHQHHDHDHANDHHHHADHHHDHVHDEMHGMEMGGKEYQDAHERAHANDIRRRFANRDVTTWQIIMFGLTGGLIPCPAAITVLLLCLQLKAISLGFVLVLCFSIGLALTLVTVGAAAALSVRHATKRWSWFGTFARKAPFFSSILIGLVGLYMAYHGLAGIAARSAAT